MNSDYKETPYVSVIIPVYNLQCKIRTCIDSVINQTFKSLQIILVDDGSTDNSYDICMQYAKKDPRILVEHQENRGVSAARNTGLRKAEGSYVMFIDGDDYISRDYIESYAFLAKSTGADIIIGGIRKREQGKEETLAPLSGQYDTKAFFSLLCKEGTLTYGYVCCKLYRLSIIKDNVIIFNENMYSQEDLDFALSVYEKAGTIVCFDNCGYFYEYVPSSRKPLPQSVLGNQVKLFDMAESVGAETGPMISRFQSMLFTWLYYAHSVKEVNEIIGMNIPSALLIEIEGQRKETGLILKLFRLHKADSIYRYFHIRGKLRSMLVGFHLAKPAE